MRIAKRLGLMLLTVCALSALAVSSASAIPLFLATQPGALLLASAGTSTQTFHTGPAGNIECTALKLLPPGDTAPSSRAASLLVFVDYEKCKAFGLTAVVHPVHYLIFASGLVKLVDNAVILATSGCRVTVPAEKNQSLWTVKFENTPANGGILLLTAVTGITSIGEVGGGGLCVYPEEHEGTYTGTIHVRSDGGVISWDANA